MSLLKITTECFPAILVVVIVILLIVGNIEPNLSIFEFGKSYTNFNGFFCSGWAGICR